MIGRKYGDPFARLEENIKKNPLGGDRQRRDLQELHKYNRNPRLNKITSIQLPRSQTFEPPQNDAKVLKQALVKLKIDALNQMKLVNSSDQIHQIEEYESKHRCIDYEEKNFAYTIPRTIYISFPPTFGHQPGSASRIIYPKTLIDRHIHKNNNKNKTIRVNAKHELSNANTNIGMSSKLLHHLLHNELKPHHQNVQKKKHIPVELEETNANDITYKMKALNQRTDNIQLSEIDDSFYKVWGLNERLKWDKTSFVKSSKDKHPVSSRCQIGRNQNNPIANSKVREDIDRINAPYDFAPSSWQVELNKKLSIRRNQSIRRRPNATQKYIDSIVHLNHERKQKLNRHMQWYMRAVELERTEKIKDKRTLTSHWERIVRCR